MSNVDVFAVRRETENEKELSTRSGSKLVRTYISVTMLFYPTSQRANLLTQNRDSFRNRKLSTIEKD